MSRLMIMACEFTRDKRSPKELGVCVNEGSGPIIDMEGKVVPAPVWDYRLLPYEGTVIVGGVS